MCSPRTKMVRLLVVLVGLGSLAAAESGTVNIPFAESRSILDVLQPQLWPVELRGKTPAALESLWPEWVMREDAAIGLGEGETEDRKLRTILVIGRQGECHVVHHYC